MKCNDTCGKIVIHAVDMKIEEVKVNGRQVPYTYTGKEIEIYPEKASKGDALEIPRYRVVKPKAGVWLSRQTLGLLTWHITRESRRYEVLATDV